MKLLLDSSYLFPIVDVDIVEGWIIFKGVKYEPTQGEGYLRIDIPEMDAGTFSVYTYAWIEGYVAISEIIRVSFSNSAPEPSDDEREYRNHGEGLYGVGIDYTLVCSRCSCRCSDVWVDQEYHSFPASCRGGR